VASTGRLSDSSEIFICGKLGAS